MLDTRERLERHARSRRPPTPAARAAAVAAAAFARLWRAADPRLGRERVVVGELDAVAPRPGTAAEAARHDGDVVGPLPLEGPELGSRVGLERPVPVEVVGLEVRQHRDARAERLDVLELERGELAHDPRVRRRRPDEGRQRPPDVARDLRRDAGGVENRAEQRRGRRLPVRPRHADERVREQSHAELDLAR